MELQSAPLPPTVEMFRRDADIAHVPGFSDATVQMLMATPDMQASKVFRHKGDVEPERSLSYDTVGCLLSGRLKLRIGDTEFTAEAGDVWMYPEGVAHTSEVLEDSLHFEITAPGCRSW
jgi:quercetin dioxygenase-like cupin family protein